MEPVPVDEATAVPGVFGRQVSYALDDSGAWIAQARHLAAAFLTRARAEEGLPVPTRAVEITQLVVSELVTNARKYAPGPIGLDLRLADDAVEVIVHDGNPTAPVPRGADPGRVGQHGLEIVMAVVQTLDIRQQPAGKTITARISLSV